MHTNPKTWMYPPMPIHRNDVSLSHHKQAWQNVISTKFSVQQIQFEITIAEKE